MYWIWKNINVADYEGIGLCHYRRFLGSYSTHSIVSSKEITQLLKRYDVILPEKSRFVTSVRNQLIDSSLSIENYKELESYFKNQQKEYYKSFQKIMNGNQLSIANVCIMNGKLFNDYCQWLFEVMLDLEKVMKVDNDDTYLRRIYGFISERLLNVWVKNKHLKVAYLPMVSEDNNFYVGEKKSFVKQKLIALNDDRLFLCNRLKNRISKIR